MKTNVLKGLILALIVSLSIYNIWKGSQVIPITPTTEVLDQLTFNKAWGDKNQDHDTPDANSINTHTITQHTTRKN